MPRNRKSRYQTLGGNSWRKARAELLSRGDIQYCWRCGKELHATAQRGTPHFITLGHYTALMDGGSKYDPNGYGPECAPCNYSDGARRKNGQAAKSAPLPDTYYNDNW